MGHGVTVAEMSIEDIEQELAEFEAKYGMTSEEFAGKWNRGEMDCRNRLFRPGDCTTSTRARTSAWLGVPQPSMHDIRTRQVAGIAEIHQRKLLRSRNDFGYIRR